MVLHEWQVSLDLENAKCWMIREDTKTIEWCQSHITDWHHDNIKTEMYLKFSSWYILDFYYDLPDNSSWVLWLLRPDNIGPARD